MRIDHRPEITKCALSGRPCPTGRRDPPPYRFPTLYPFLTFCAKLTGSANPVALTVTTPPLRFSSLARRFGSFSLSFVVSPAEAEAGFSLRVAFPPTSA